MTALTREQIAAIRSELGAVITLFATRMKPEQRHAKCATFLLENGSNVFALLDIAEAVDGMRALVAGWRGEVADIDSRPNIGDITFGLREQLNECANEIEAVLPLDG